MTVRLPQPPLPPVPRLPRAPLALAVGAALGVLMASASAQAQVAPPAAAASAPAQQLQRVEITGSAIKRIADEGALPVQVISRQDIVKAGVTTDGRFGPNTKRAVQAWQRRHGLTPDGLVGAATWAAMLTN